MFWTAILALETKQMTPLRAIPNEVKKRVNHKSLHFLGRNSEYAFKLAHNYMHFVWGKHYTPFTVAR
jgi:hypothetical protein